MVSVYVEVLIFRTRPENLQQNTLRLRLYQNEATDRVLPKAGAAIPG